MITQRLSLGCLLGALVIGLLSGPVAAATLELTGPDGATVSLNDRPLGAFPLTGPLDLPPGSYTIHVRRQGYAPYDQTVRLLSINDWQRVTVRLTPYSRRVAWSSNILLAGMGQHYLGHSFRGYVYNAAEVGGLLTALAAELQRSNLKSDYLKLVSLYSSSINAEEIVQLSATAETKYNDMQDMETLRDTGLVVAGSAIVVSIIDALLAFPSVEAGGGAVPVETGRLDQPAPGNTPDLALHAGVRLTF